MEYPVSDKPREIDWAVFYDAFKQITNSEIDGKSYQFKDDERDRLVVLAEDIFGIQLSIMEMLNARTLLDLERQIQHSLNTQPESNP
jgi:hypothetical protein